MSDAAAVEVQEGLCPATTDQVVTLVIQVTEALSGVRFYDYQTLFARRIVESVIVGDAGTLTALWARQCGKTETIADVAVGMAIVLPAMAESFPGDGRFKPFKAGFKVGIYAPVAHQAAIAFSRMRNVVSSERGQAVLSDPEINVRVTTDRADMIGFDNGSRILAKSASPDTQIEGDTHNLIILEEAQKLSRSKVEKEILPMRSATGGTVVKIGTAYHSRGGFHVSIQDNIDQYKKGGKRNHYEFPYTIVIEAKRRRYNEEVEQFGEAGANPFHLKYEQVINEEIRKLGGTDNEEFKMNYMCIWMESRILAIKPSVMNKAMKPFEAGCSRHGFQVAGLDIGGTNDATVLTTMLVAKDKPFRNTFHLPEADEDLQLYYPKTILDWVELMGDFEGDEGQYIKLVEYISRTNIQVLCVDATSVGNPVFQRIQAMLSPAVHVEPIIFSLQMKHNLYKYYLQELNAGRVFYAAGKDTQQRREYQKFQKEHTDLDKVQRGAYVVCEASEGEHDDYPDSAALACWAEKIADTVVMPTLEVQGVGAMLAQGGGHGDATSQGMSRRPPMGGGRSSRYSRRR